MSMNFTDNKKPTQTPKKNNTKTIVVLVIIGFITIFAAIGLYQETKKTINNIITTEPPTSDLEQKLFTKCQNLQDYYNSIGVQSDYKCEQYAKAYSGLVK